MLYTLHSFVRLVKSLRAVQKASGSGYKTAAAGTAAAALEKEVDAAIARVEMYPKPLNEPPSPCGPSSS
jgi:hypothetical protein